MMKKLSALLFIFTVLITPLFAFNVTSTSLHLYLAGITKAVPPAIVEDHLILSVEGDYRYVGVSFSHESWKKTYSFEKNKNGIFVFALPIPFGHAQTSFYRLIVDGLWISDPTNSMNERDYYSGITMSKVNLPERSETVLGYWKPEQVGGANFWFTGEPNKRVTVTGSFNGWDPFLYEMEEVRPGCYQLSLRMSAGKYYYCFMYNGEKIPDPLNENTLYAKDGTAVSLLVIPE